MRSIRWRAALAVSAVLAAAVPAVSQAYAPAFKCRGITNIGSWQKIPVERFAPIEGVQSTDVVTGYSLAATKAQQVVATNGKRLKVSSTSGCDWSDGLALGLQPSADVPLTGTTSTIVATAALPSGRVLAAVREGTGPASRPHVVGSDNGRTDYRLHDSGLPPQGAPRVLEAADDGRNIYLVLTPTSGDGGTGGTTPLPGLPDIDSPTSGAKAGLLYGSKDGGRTWSLRTTAGDLPGGAGLDQLAVDHTDPNRLYAISNGLFLYSTDGGATFQRVRVRAQDQAQDLTAVETGPGGYVIAFSAGGQAILSNDGRSFFGLPAPAGITSAAYRPNDLRLAVEARGRLMLVNLGSATSEPVNGFTVRQGSLMADVGKQATYHALSGHSLVRYTDPPPEDPFEAPATLGDLDVPPPPPGTITPSARTVQLKVGDSTVLDYELALPKSPTPLDLFFLIDASGSMNGYIQNLKDNIGQVVKTINRAGIDLKVGVATLGTGNESGDNSAPYLNPADPSDRGPKLYELFRRIGEPDPDFAQALQRVDVKDKGGGTAEAQNVALEQATAGLGVRDPRSPDAAPLFLVPPGQDAGWRPQPNIRRVIVHATDEAFAKPVGTRLKDGAPDHDYTIALMNEYRVQQIGLTIGSIESQGDLARIARGTRTFAPPGGADCGMDVVLPAGSPLVCDTEGDFSALIGRVVSSLTDRQPVQIVARGRSPKIIRAIDASRLRSVDVTKANVLPFKVAVTCKGQSVGRYTEEIAAGLRGTKVASSRLTVDCIGPAAAAALAIPPAIAAGAPPAPPPVAQGPAAVVPAPPAVQPQLQPQSQPQVQSQVNPMTAAAMQQQEELQLALALQAGVERPEEEPQMAMVGQRRVDDSAALVLLAAAMAASAGLGLARLRSRPDPSVVRVRR